MTIGAKQLKIIDFEENDVESFIIDSSVISQEERDDAVRLFNYLKTGFGEGIYQRILKSLKFSCINKNNSILLNVPNEFIRNIILQSYFREISAFVHTNCKSAQTIEIAIKNEKKDNKNQSQVVNTSVPVVPTKSVEVEYFTNNTRIDHTKNFDQFILSKTNELAYWSAKQCSEMILKNDHEGISSLCLFGPIGMGKSHLMNSIISHVKSQNDNAKIDYISAEDFKDSYIEAVRRNKLYNFKRRFSQLDALLIDDVQFIKSSTGSLEREFGRLLNSFIDSKRWVVLACDRPPSKLSVDDRTKMRISSGLKADIRPSDFQLRMMILKTKLEELYQAYDIPHHLLEYIAQNVFTSIRELEGKLRSIITYAMSLKTKLVKEGMVQKFVEEIQIIKETPKNSDIISFVCNYYGIKSKDLLGSSRVKKVSRARAAAAYLVRNNTTMTLQEIGDMLDRKHSTIMYLINAVEGDQSLLSEVNSIGNKL